MHARCLLHLLLAVWLGLVAVGLESAGRFLIRSALKFGVYYTSISSGDAPPLVGYHLAAAHILWLPLFRHLSGTLMSFFIVACLDSRQAMFVAP